MTTKSRKPIHHRALGFLHHAFIPHAGNNHRPHALRPPALKAYSAVLIGIKIFITAFLFITYPTAAEFSTISASRIIQLTNSSRSQNGLTSLRESSTLDRAAFAKAKDMVANDYFAHTGPDGKRPWDWIKEAGYAYTLAGENLARDFSSAEATQNALMASESHKANILNPRYTEMGASVVYGDDTVVMVMYFATPKSVAVAPTKPAAPTPTPTPTPSPTTPTPTVPTTTVTPKPVVLTYVATHVGQSSQAIEADPGTTTEVWVDYRNDGNTTWSNSGDNYFALNLTDPAGRVSVFADPSWPKPYQPAKLDQATVKPGETGRFTFKLTMPETPGVHNEHFAVVAEGLVWLEGGILELPIAVKAPVPTTPTIGTATPPAPVTPPTSEPTPQTIETDNSIFETVRIANEPLRGEVLAAIVAAPHEKNFQGQLLYYSQRFFLFFMAFLGVALLINLVVKIRHQHLPTILQTVLVLVVAAGLLLSRFHFLEQFITKVQIL